MTFKFADLGIEDPLVVEAFRDLALELQLLEARLPDAGGAGGTEVNDLSAAVTWANIPSANVPEAAVTQHEAAIDHDALANFLAAEHIDWAVTGAENVHADRLPSAAPYTATVRRTTDATAITNDITFTADTVLTGLVIQTADTWYEIEGVLRVQSNITPDFKLRFVMTNNAQIVGIQVHNISTTGGHNSDAASGINTAILLQHGGTTVNVYAIKGVFLSNATTPGTMELQWAQSTSSGDSTNLLAGSYIKIKE